MSEFAPRPLLALVSGRLGAGLWRVDSLASDTAALATGFGWRVLTVDLDGVTDKADLLTRLGQGGHFPDWFGHNWDAAADCLSDLSWLGDTEGPASRVLVVINDADDLAADLAAVLGDVLAEASAGWAKRGVNFSVVWEGNARWEGAQGPAIPALDAL